MDFKKTIKQSEGRRLEFKERVPGKADLCKTILAFANDAGDILFICIQNTPRKVIGLPESELINIEEHISNLIFDNCYPIISPDISTIISHWEYPVAAIREAIRNAVIHRDYSLSGKDIKIAIFDDLIEITNPGKLIPSIDFDKMDARQSDIRNKVIAPLFKHFGLIDQWGNGLKLIYDQLKKYTDIEFKWYDQGMQFQVQFVKTNYKKPLTTDHVTDHVKQLINELNGEMSRDEIIERLKLKHNPTFRQNYLLPALEAGLIEMTQPDSPKSPKQKYRLTDKGKRLLENRENSK